MAGVAAFRLLLAAITTAAAAEVVDSGPGGFTVRTTVHVAAPADKVYAALVQPARWWNSEHTFSGDARNLSLDAQPGGCFCETLKNGGGVRHQTVVYVDPGRVLRLRGPLGPAAGAGRRRRPDLRAQAGGRRRRPVGDLRGRRLRQGRAGRLAGAGGRGAGRTARPAQAPGRDRPAGRGEEVGRRRTDPLRVCEGGSAGSFSSRRRLRRRPRG